MSTFINELENLSKQSGLPNGIVNTLQKFYHSYSTAVVKNGHAIEEYEPLLLNFLSLIQKQLLTPHPFEPFHTSIRAPFDYYHFGLDFMRPLVIFEKSKLFGKESLEKIQEQLSRKENVILFANHQTEPDPQAISLLLEKNYPQLAEGMIFVAGQRVITDPLAVPFSLGRNLLCIYSKKYIESPPEKKQEKILHNQNTMKKMRDLLSEGGKCIYVAPSGGRDRPNDQGVVVVAKFDPQSIEMFYLIGEQAGKPTHFYPLSLVTYDLLPPPYSVRKELGEKRLAQCTPIRLFFGKEIEMEKSIFASIKDKRQRRKMRADSIWEEVKKNYEALKEETP